MRDVITIYCLSNKEILIPQNMLNNLNGVRIAFFVFHLLLSIFFYEDNGRSKEDTRPWPLPNGNISYSKQ